MRNILIIIYITFIFISCKNDKSNIEYDVNKNNIYFFENKEIISDSARVIFNRGLEEKQFENIDSTLELFKKANEIENNNPTIINGLANLEFSKGNKYHSYELFKKCLSIDSTNVNTYVNFAASYMKDRRYLDASEMLKKGLRYVSEGNNHQKSILYLNLGISYNNMDDCSNGYIAANQALKFSQNSDFTKLAKKIIKDSKQLCANN